MKIIKNMPHSDNFLISSTKFS